MKEILLAIATDVRIASGNELERVGSWLHVDEHQLFGNDVKIKLQLNDDLSLEEHKNFLSPAMRALSSVWRYENNIFLFLFLASEN